MRNLSLAIENILNKAVSSLVIVIEDDTGTRRRGDAERLKCLTPFPPEDYLFSSPAAPAAPAASPAIST